MPEIEQSMRKLKLGGMAKNWRSVAYRDNEQYVSELLELELREREAKRINRMVKTAGFQVVKTLDEFIWNDQIALPVGLTREYMETLRFLDAKENLIFLGSVGTGWPQRWLCSPASPERKSASSPPRGLRTC